MVTQKKVQYAIVFKDKEQLCIIINPNWDQKCIEEWSRMLASNYKLFGIVKGYI